MANKLAGSANRKRRTEKEGQERKKDMANDKISFRKAGLEDVDAIAEIYEKIHDAEEAGELTTGWLRGIYPTRDTALAGIDRDDLFVAVEEGAGGEEKIIGAAVINQIQVDVYEGAPWEYDAPDDEVMVLHALVISPDLYGSGYGRAFVGFYEQYALEHGCRYLRIDTNERNKRARAFYESLGYKEITIVPTVFNGIPGVGLVLIEKTLDA